MINLQFSSLFLSYFFLSLFLFTYLILKNKQEFFTYSGNTIFNVFLLNFFFFGVCLLSYKDYSDVSSAGPLLDSRLLKIFVLSASVLTPMYLLFLKSVNVYKYYYNVNFWVSILVFFFFCVLACSLPYVADNLIFLEFLNMGLLLFLVSSLGSQSLGSHSFKNNQGFNVNYNSPFYFSFSILNFIFSMFFVSLFFFLFFLYFFYFTFGTNSYSSFNYLLKYFNSESNLLIFFFFLLMFKLGGAPFFIWKVELFDSLSMLHVLFYSIVYLFYLFFFFFTIFTKFSVYFYFTKNSFLYPILLFNLVFLVSATNGVSTVRQFVVISTLINSIFFFLSIVSTPDANLNFFFIFFFNYAVTSFNIFFFLTVFKPGTVHIFEVQKLRNNWVNFFYFGAPLISMAGVAPTLGFIFKFIFIVSQGSHNNLPVLVMLSFLIIYTSVFYFQFFKNFFFYKKKNFKNATVKSPLVLNENYFLVYLLATIFGLSMLLSIFQLYSLIFLLDYLSLVLA